MAMKFDPEVGVKRGGDTWKVYPENIIVSHELNSREVKHTPESTFALACRMASEGQLQNALGRKVEGNKVQLVFGYGRTEAIRLLNKAIDGDENLRKAFQEVGVELPAERMYVRLDVRDMTEEEAFSYSITENLDRDELTPLDITYQQRILRERYGWSEERIAKKYKMTQAYVSTLRKTFQLDQSILDEVKDGNASLTTLVQSDLPNLPVQEQREIVEANKDAETGKVDVPAVAAAARDRQTERGKKGKGRNMTEVRKFFEELLEDENAVMRSLSQEFLKFFSGRIGADLMLRRFREHLNGKEAA